MTAAEYESWVEYHRTLFTMKSADDGPMFALWAQCLLSYSLAELKAASLAIASDIETAGRYRTEHLAILRQKVAAHRFERIRAEQQQYEASDARLSCSQCRGNGLVPVPHVESIVDGRWAYPFCSMVVSCDCSAGTARGSAINGVDTKQVMAGRRVSVRILSLAEYEALHPQWCDIVAERNRTRQTELEARYYAEQADRAAPIRAANVREVLAGIGNLQEGR